MKLKKNIKLLITADGSAASGKTTGARLISKKYGLKFLSSGLLYRYVGYKLLLKKNKKNRSAYIKSIVKNIKPSFLKNKRLLEPKITQYSSIVAQSKFIRDILKKYQKNFAKEKLVCIEGRDIGTVICPNADIKFFFKCSLNIKANRRLKELKKGNKKIRLVDVKKALKKRDLIDRNRKISPLRSPRSAYIVDTSKLNKKQMLDKLSKVIENKLLKKYGRSYKTK